MTWRQIELQQIATITGGSTPRRDHDDYWGGSIPWLTPTDLPMPGEGIAAVIETANCITEDGLASCSAALLPIGTVLFSSRATIGKLGIAAVPLTTNQGFANFIPGNAVDSKYLAYCLQNLTGSIAGLAGSTTFKEVTKTALKKVKVPLPALSEQRRIVEILDQADTLRQQRRAADEKAQRILPAFFHTLFGDPLTSVGHGDCISIGELNVNLQNGFACGEKDVEDGIPHLRMNNIDDEGVLNIGLVRTVPQDRVADRYRLLDRDVLFMGTNSQDKVGKTCLFVPPDGRTYLFSNHLIRLRVEDERITPEYLAGFLHLLWSKGFFPSIAKRWVNQSSVAQTTLANLRIPIPPEHDLSAFTKAYRDLVSMRSTRISCGSQITRTFEVLLHRAFTGELTIKWREAHKEQLEVEMQEQMAALQETKANRPAGGRRRKMVK